MAADEAEDELHVLEAGLGVPREPQTQGVEIAAARLQGLVQQVGECEIVVISKSHCDILLTGSNNQGRTNQREMFTFCL